MISALLSPLLTTDASGFCSTWTMCTRDFNHWEWTKKARRAF
jgi:hypothetical protein